MFIFPQATCLILSYDNIKVNFNIWLKIHDWYTKYLELKVENICCASLLNSKFKSFRISTITFSYSRVHTKNIFIYHIISIFPLECVFFLIQIESLLVAQLFYPPFSPSTKKTHSPKSMSIAVSLDQWHLDLVSKPPNLIRNTRVIKGGRGCVWLRQGD